MSMAVAAPGHDEAFAGIINNFSLAVFNKCCCALSIADVNILAVFNCKGFNKLRIFTREYLAIDD